MTELLKTMQEMAKTQIGSLASMMNIKQVEMRSNQEKAEANLKTITGSMRAWRKWMEANPGEMKSEAVHEEVPKKEAAVPFLHDARDTVVRDQARTMLQKVPRKNGRWAREFGGNQGLKERLRLGSKGNVNETLRLKVAREKLGLSSGLKNKCQALWRSRPLLKRKERLHIE
jgi:hypothetical protein